MSYCGEWLLFSLCKDFCDPSCDPSFFLVALQDHDPQSSNVIFVAHRESQPESSGALWRHHVEPTTNVSADVSERLYRPFCPPANRNNRKQKALATAAKRQCAIRTNQQQDTSTNTWGARNLLPSQPQVVDGNNPAAFVRTWTHMCTRALIHPPTVMAPVSSASHISLQPKSIPRIKRGPSIMKTIIYLAIAHHLLGPAFGAVASQEWTHPLVERDTGALATESLSDLRQRDVSILGRRADSRDETALRLQRRKWHPKVDEKGSK